MRFALLALAAAFASVSAHAQDQSESRVQSANADSVSVTIYPAGLALITETRTVTLPATAVTLVFEDVVDSLLPQSAVVSELDRPLAESNFDFDRLTPTSLLAKSIGQSVTLTRTNPATGVVRRTSATVVSVGEGVVLETVDGHEALYCSGLPERLEFAEIPGVLFSTPQLSVRLAAGVPGEQTVKLSYLAHGFEWSSDYVARLNEHGNRMDLTGWATLTNSTGTAFEQAELLLVAGQLNVIDSEDGGSRGERVSLDFGETLLDARARIVEDTAQSEIALLRDCFESDMPVDALLQRQMRALSANDPIYETVMVTGARIQREEFGDYHLYRLPWLTDLVARQTKQVLFLDRRDVRVERFYYFPVFDLDGYVYGSGGPPLTGSGGADVVAPNLVIRWENTERAGLGEPLPRGTVRVFEPTGTGEVFSGEAIVADRPVGVPVELEIGRALNLMLEIRGEFEKRARTTLEMDYRILNDKSVPIELEIRHYIGSEYVDLEVDRTSRRVRNADGYLAWRFEVPPGEEMLSYVLSAAERD